MKPTNLFYLLVFLLIVSCQSKENQRKPFIENGIEIIKVPEAGSEKDPDTYIESLELITLETKEESILSQIDLMIFRNGRFYMKSLRDKSLFVFDEAGKHLFTFEKQGDGAEEYGDFVDFKVDNEGNIYVLDYNKIMKYDGYGEFIKRIDFSLPEKYHLYPSQLALAEDAGFYLFTFVSLAQKRKIEGQHALCKIDRNGRFYGEVHFPVNNTFNGAPRFIPISETYLYLMNPIRGNDTLYYVGNDVSPAYYLDFGKRRLPVRYLDSWNLPIEADGSQYITDIIRVAETGTHLYFFEWNLNHGNYGYFYSKVTGQLISVEYSSMKTQFLAVSGFYGNDQFVGYLDAAVLIEDLTSGYLKEKYGFLKNYNEIEKTVKSLDMNSNPVLFLMKLKDSFDAGG